MCLNMERRKALLDEKNILTDFLYEVADSYVAEMQIWYTQNHKAAFYWKDELWEAKWSSGNNVMKFTIYGEKRLVPAFMEHLKEVFLVAEEFSVDIVEADGCDFEIRFWNK